jgi:hypothetical protein
MAVRWALWLGGLAFSLAVAGAGLRADIVAPYEYRTDDPTPVRVEFPGNDRPLVLHVPRSAIMFVANYDARETPVLPDSITVKGTFRFGVLAPHGKPIGEVAEYGMSADAFRRARTEVEVRGIKKELAAAIYETILLDPPQGYDLAEAQPFDGLQASEIVRYEKSEDGRVDRTRYTYYSDEVFFRGPPDSSFDYIRCWRSNTHPIVYCDYFVRVSDLVYLKATFVDFRFNGGAAFAADRMNMVLAAYCGYAQDREPARCVKASGTAHDAD